MTATARFRERVTIQAKNLVDNGKGGRTRPNGGPEWITVGADIAAEVIAMRGNEAMQHAVLRSMQIYRVTMRLRIGVTTAHRLMWRGIPMNIKAATVTPDRRELIMTCEAGAQT